MKKRLAIISILLSVCCASLTAQRRLVVTDVETLLPVAGANVQGAQGIMVTDSTGRFTAPEGDATLVVSHVNYESRIVNTSELSTDTLFIISKLLNVREVVVFGKGVTRDDRLDALNERLRMARTEAQLAAADPSKPASIPLSFFSRLIPKKWRASYRREQRRKHHEDVLRGY